MRRIGFGGSAEIFEAEHRNGRRGALKVVRSDLLEDADARERFMREGNVKPEKLFLTSEGILTGLDRRHEAAWREADCQAVLKRQPGAKRPFVRLPLWQRGIAQTATPELLRWARNLDYRTAKMIPDAALAQDALLDHIAAELVLGRYRLCVPEEATAEYEIWLADHLLLGRAVHLRFARQTGDPRDALDRFRAEAAMVTALRGVTSHVLPVVDADAAPNGVFLVAEHRGEPLAERLAAGDTQNMARRLEAIADVISSAAGLGIVHCDLRPETIFVEGSGEAERLFVGGFHMARPAMSLPAQGPLQAENRASVDFLSPEQILGDSADPANDRWAFAGLAFLLLTGRRPFQGTTAAQTLLAILAKPHLRATELRPELPRGVDAWFDRAFAKDPALRFRTVEQMLHALRPLLETSTKASNGRSPKWRGRPSAGRMRLMLSALGVMVALGILPGAAAPDSAGASMVAQESAPSSEPGDSEEAPLVPPRLALATARSVCESPRPFPPVKRATADLPKPAKKEKAHRTRRAAIAAPAPHEEWVDESAIH